LTPGFTFAVKGALRAGPLRAFPAALTALAGSLADAAGPRLPDDVGQQDPGEYGEFAGTFDDAALDSPGPLLTVPPGDEAGGLLAWDDDPDADRAARHRRP
jgi:hypothetical protein